MDKITNILQELGLMEKPINEHEIAELVQPIGIMIISMIFIFGILGAYVSNRDDKNKKE